MLDERESFDDDKVDDSVDESRDWSLTIHRVDNGFRIIDQDSRETVFEEAEDFQTPEDGQMIRRMLYFIIDFFALGGGKHDPERISVDIQPGEKYVPPTGDVMPV